MLHHTSTHLLNWALRDTLEIHGDGKVDQKGSLVDPQKTRFDFSHHAPLTHEQIARIEDLCRKQIEAALPVYAASREEDFVDQQQARQINTLRAVFGEKYPDKVRVVSIGAPITEEDARKAGASDWLLKSPKDPKWMNYSVEFCGGTHVKNTSEIKDFTLISEEGVARGVRRLVGVSGDAAVKARARGDQLIREARALQSIDQQPSTIDNPLSDRLTAFTRRLADAQIPLTVRHEIRRILDELQKQAKKMDKQAAADAGGAVTDKVASLLAEARTITGVTVVVGEVPPAPVDALRSAIDWVRNKTPASAVLLAFAEDGKVTLMAGMSKAVVEKGVKAGDLIREIAPLVGGRGGGRPDMAQGGGTDPARLPDALAAAAQWLAARLS